MQTKHCAACGQRFEPRSQTQHQAYCSKPDCQRTRRLKWQRDRLKTDPDYVDNQVRAQQAWCARNPDYWKNYRAAHPDYAKQNREKQRERNASGAIDRNNGIAKMDASNPTPAPPPGIYHMQSVTRSSIAKMDVWTVELRVIARAPPVNSSIAKR